MRSILMLSKSKTHYKTLRDLVNKLINNGICSLANAKKVSLIIRNLYPNCKIEAQLRIQKELWQTFQEGIVLYMQVSSGIDVYRCKEDMFDLLRRVFWVLSHKHQNELVEKY